MTKYIYNTEIFTSETSESFYLLGAFMADGHIKKSGSVSLSSKDEDWLSLLRDVICNKLPLQYANSSKTVKAIVINSKIIRSWLLSYECTPQKSLTLKFPEIPEKYLPDFLRGYLDGDGHIGVHKQSKSGRNKKLNFNVSCEFTTASEKFSTKLSEILNSLGFKNSIKTINPGSRANQFINSREIIQKNNIYQIKISSNYAYKFINYIYYNDKLLSMPRKHDIARFILANCFKHKENKRSETDIIDLLNNYHCITDKYSSKYAVCVGKANSMG